MVNCDCTLRLVSSWSRYGNKTINYLGTTKLKCNHNGTEIDAIFYITDVPDTKIIIGL